MSAIETEKGSTSANHTKAHVEMTSTSAAAEALGVTIEVSETDETEEEATSSLPTWESELAFEGLATTDGRYLIPGGMTNRDLPLSLMIQTKTADGHDGAEICGKLTRIWRVERSDLGSGVVAVMGSGEFSEGQMGPEAAQLVEDEILRGVSVDIAATRHALLDAETKEEVPEEDISFEKWVNGEYLIGIEGEYMGATLCAFPAFADARMRIVPNDEASTDEAKVLTASAGQITLIRQAITASAAGLAPLRPPKNWFFAPEPEGKVPLTIDDDGFICGHLATWDQCHHGFANECVLAKPSRTAYALFHVGALKTAEGETINVGRIVVGENEKSGHADINLDAVTTNEFYDKTALVGAFVRAVDGKYGIWLSGAVRSDCPAEKVRDMLANPPSGDWRRDNGWLELIAALSVPVPGFPVPRYEYSLVASGGEEVEIKALVATGYYVAEAPTYSRAEMRRKELLLREGRAA